jgi:hypothetical protein
LAVEYHAKVLGSSAASLDRLYTDDEHLV